jgi:Tfp pilus assembly protein PilW
MTWRARLRDERGYTLIELILASAAGLLVSGAALAIIAVSYELLRNDADRVDANQQGRTAMLEIEQLLNSSCVGGLGYSPVQAGSANSITFVASQADNPAIPPSEYQIYLSGSNQLDLTNYGQATGGSAPTWTFSSSGPTQTLIAHAALVPGTSAIFSYYPYTSTGALQTGSLTSVSQGSNVAEIGIQFEAQPTDGVTVTGSNADFASEVVLRLTPVSTSTLSTTPLPCS